MKKDNRRRGRQHKHDAEAEQRAASLVLDSGMTQHQAAARSGMTRLTLRAAIAREQGRREGGSIPYHVVRAKLTPIINALEDLAGRAPGTIPGGSVSIQAARIRNQLKEWREAGEAGRSTRRPVPSTAAGVRKDVPLEIIGNEAADARTGGGSPGNAKFADRTRT